MNFIRLGWLTFFEMIISRLTADLLHWYTDDFLSMIFTAKPMVSLFTFATQYLTCPNVPFPMVFSKYTFIFDLCDTVVLFGWIEAVSIRMVYFFKNDNSLNINVTWLQIKTNQTTKPNNVPWKCINNIWFNGNNRNPVTMTRIARPLSLTHPTTFLSVIFAGLL